MKDLENRIRRAFGMPPAESNFLIVVQAYYNSRANREDHDSAFNAALAAYCLSNNASPADVSTRTMVGVLIAEAGVEDSRGMPRRRMQG